MQEIAFRLLPIPWVGRVSRGAEEIPIVADDKDFSFERESRKLVSCHTIPIDLNHTIRLEQEIITNH